MTGTEVRTPGAGNQGDRSRRRGFGADDRSVSITVNYALNLAVATLLVTGVLTATGGMVENRRSEAIRTELSVIGERIATDLMAADKLAAAATARPDANPTVAVTLALPDRVAGRPYEVSVETSPARIVLASENPDVTVTVSYRHDTGIAETTVRGGDLRVVLNTDPDPNRLEVSEA